MKILKLKFSELPQDTDTPVIDYCRKLLKEGEAPDTWLELYRERKTPDIIVRNISNAAKLRVSDNKFKLDTKYIKNNPVEAGSSPVH